MNAPNQSKALVQPTFATLTALVMISVLASNLCCAEPNADTSPPKTDFATSPTNSVALKTQVPDAKPAVVKRQLTGAELYSMNCNRCHQERYPTERTAAQWKTIMLHMQVRANIPVSQSRLILQYLQDNSGR